MAKRILKFYKSDDSESKAISPAFQPQKVAKSTAPTTKKYKLSNIESLGRSNIVKDSAATAVETVPNSPVLQASRVDLTGATNDESVAVKQDTHFGRAVNDLFNAAAPEHKNIYKKEFKEAYTKFHGRSIIPFRTENAEIQWHLRGMKSKLMHHQFLGTAALRDREHGEVAPFGGLLADEMGFGKTVMMLANIVDGRAEMKKQRTLIVAAPSLIRQWNDEIAKHCDQKAIGKVILYCAGSRLITNNKKDPLRTYNIVLTTYHEVMKSFPHFKPPPTDDSPEGHQELRNWQAEAEKNKGILHKAQFDRIVLDEAQAIKNHLSHKFHACQALQGKYRWAISGTPLQDRATETFAYFQFLGVPGPSTMRLFKQMYFIEDKSVEGGKIDTTLLRQTLSKFLIRRTHETLILGKPVVALPKSVERIISVELNSAEQLMYQKLDIRVRKAVARVLREAEDAGMDKDTKDIRARVMVILLRLRQLLTHFILVAPLVSKLLDPDQQEALLSAALDPMAARSANSISAVTKVFRTIAKRTLRSQSGENVLKQSFTKLWVQKENQPTLHSAKTRAIINQIQNWIDKDGVVGQVGGKIIIFAQFIEFIRMFESVCRDKGWLYKSFHGQMAISTRMKAKQDWAEDPQIRILIASLGAGGNGINLTDGSRVILVDLWWNTAVEQQAFARVFRIGQKRNCELVRLVVYGTHDDRMLQLQEMKAAEIGALMNGTSKGPTSKELLFVMGIDLENYQDISDDDSDDEIDFEKLDVRDGEDESDTTSSSSSTESDEGFTSDDEDDTGDHDVIEGDVDEDEDGLEDIDLDIKSEENKSQIADVETEMDDFDTEFCDMYDGRYMHNR